MTDPAENAQALAEAVAKGMQAKDRVFHMLGMCTLSVGPGRATLEMVVRDDMLNGHDICHGGMVFALADTAFAYAANSANRATVSTDANISFMAAAEPGETLTARAEERAVAGRTGIYDVSVTGRGDRPIALFRCRAHRLDSATIAEPETREGEG